MKPEDKKNQKIKNITDTILQLLFVIFSFLCLFVAKLFIVYLFELITVLLVISLLSVYFKHRLIVLLIIILFFTVTMARIYSSYGIVNVNGDIIKDFYQSLYFSIVTLTTLGYGDFSPTEQIKLVAAFEAIIGYFLLAIMIVLTLNTVNKKEMKFTHTKDEEHFFKHLELFLSEKQSGKISDVSQKKFYEHLEKYLK